MRIRKDARDRYAFDESLFSSTGHLVLESIRSAHVFANTFNAGRPESEQLSPALLNAASVVHEILHFAIEDFLESRQPDLLDHVLRDAEAELGTEEVDETLEQFVEQFPTSETIREEVSASAYLSQETGGTGNREVTLEEILICWLSNDNPAYEAFEELIRDDDLRDSTEYERLIQRFTAPDPDSALEAKASRALMDLLQEPIRRAPYSLKDQLSYMTGGEWDIKLPADLVRKAAVGSDLIDEEERAMAARHFAPGPSPPPPVPDFLDEPEYEKFSPDVDWMPRVVMMAKNAFVWLDQLSRKHERPITRLDQIPEEELKQLADWGFTALWLIGIWERSEASKKLKHRLGNPDAEASAYSIVDYVVSDALGGTGALTGLRMACQQYGIRLCADMVPNHTGIDSKWLAEHPDWFIQLPYPPYPSYSYSSESLSSDPNLVIQVEDGYYDRSDAAVTFRLLDTRTGDERFVYHGNDGTSMPWNDTAQLDFTKEEVREAVIQTILHVARQFPVIRFDAAMVLTRKHFRRLWYPPPGSGGGVPSRVEYGMTREEFDRAMPTEFWREVVDRVAEEVPDTLLLAEAFWLLEGYFVRTLGMHRVYNSAFMHMLKDEDNAKYREVIKNTLAFEPEILKRYVNFMSNPDEETALEQFGDGDKFFGVCTLLVTLPGLPMFGHGQVEGFAEKYGMEYRRAYRDEPVRQSQVERFEREITPLMRKRSLFADVANFRLFDFETPGSGVDENVFAYSNRQGIDRALIVYNNRYERTSGRIGTSTRLEEGPPAVSLGNALQLDREDGDFVTYTDLVTGKQHVAPANSFFDGGFPLSLQGYEYHAFIGFEVVEDDDGTLKALADRLDGRGVDSLEEARIDIRLKPLEQLATHVVTEALSGGVVESVQPELLHETASIVGAERRELVSAFDELAGTIGDVLDLTAVGERFKWARSPRYRSAVAELEEAVRDTSSTLAVLIGAGCRATLDRFEVAGVRRITRNVLLRSGLATHQSVETIEALAHSFSNLEADTSALSQLLDTPRFASAFLVNEFAGTTYYNGERFELGATVAFCLDVLSLVKEAGGRTKRETARAIADTFDELRKFRAAHQQSEYDWEILTRRMK